MHSSPRASKSHCCHQHSVTPGSHLAVVNVFNAVLDAEVLLTGQHQHPCDKLCVCSSYPGGISELCLHIDEVGQAQPHSGLCCSSWDYIWAEFALCIEVSFGFLCGRGQSWKKFMCKCPHIVPLEP